MVITNFRKKCPTRSCPKSQWRHGQSEQARTSPGVGHATLVMRQPRQADQATPAPIRARGAKDQPSRQPMQARLPAERIPACPRRARTAGTSSAWRSPGSRVAKARTARVAYTPRRIRTSCPVAIRARTCPWETPVRRQSAASPTSRLPNASETLLSVTFLNVEARSVKAAARQRETREA